MTAQAMEQLIYNGEKVGMAACPLDDYFKSIDHEPHFTEPNTACWRGYIGTWEVKNDKLYLVDLHIFFPRHEDDGIPHYFPGEKEVFAYWYTGTIRIPIGKILDYVHGGFGSVYEQDLLFEIDKGKVVKKSIRDNRDRFAKDYYDREDELPF